MRISPPELQAVRQAGMLTRYALLGPVAYILVDLPATGTEGTGLERPCLVDHHGIVSKGSFTVHHEDGRSETFEAGDAFYVPAGPPSHHFSSSPGCVVGGFAAITEPPDVSEEALTALGFTVVARPSPPTPLPTRVSLAGAVEPFQRQGAIDVEGSRMGAWVFMRARFGPRSGYTGGWCDLPHWGLVLDGEVAISYPDRTELASRGDVYFTPPGHRFASPDGATIIDYTPDDGIEGKRIPSWRRAALDRAPRGGQDAADPLLEPASRPGRPTSLRRAADPG